jgi:hypothetical protein
MCRRIQASHGESVMKVIQPNCRVQFTAEDIRFILSVLGPGTGDSECLVKLLTDEASRDLILDDEALFGALLEQRRCLRVSSRFYFYVLVRRVLRVAGIEDRAVADYVAEVLAEFSHAERCGPVLPGESGTLDYFVDLLAALRRVDERAGFVIRAHIGNYSLFLAGVFPDRIRFRAESRGFPDLRYYEELGRASYRVARDHRLAHKYDLAHIFNTLSGRFQAARLALNDLSERLISLGDTESAFLLASE